MTDASARVSPVDAARLAIGTLTAFPCPAPARVDPRVGGAAMAIAWLPGLLIATIVAAVVGAGVWVGLPNTLVGVIGVAAAGIASRWLHWDGLADTADGMYLARDKDRALAVMRQSDIGPMGVISLVFVGLAQTAAIAALSEQHVWAVWLAVFISRAGLALSCAKWFRPARHEGLGQLVIGQVPTAGAVSALGLCALSAAAVISWADWVLWWIPVVVLVSGLASHVVLSAYCQRLFGGLTGDTLGAAVEGAAVIGLAAAVIAL